MQEARMQGYATAAHAGHADAYHTKQLQPAPHCSMPTKPAAAAAGTLVLLLHYCCEAALVAAAKLLMHMPALLLLALLNDLCKAGRYWLVPLGCITLAH